MTRIAIVNKERCSPVKCGWLCFNLCPINRSGKECITKEDKARIDEALCNGCGICQNRCPMEAIKIVNLPEKLAEKPVHRYGENGFCLYDLPTPFFGKVTGIIGKNGIGKSTAVKILANLMKPNLGKKEATKKELLEYFKGTEAQVFFEKLEKNEIIASYKPQNVDDLAVKYKGKIVKELLKKIDEKKILAETAKILEIDNVLDNKIDEVSGGELQRIAIAACIMKKANLYIFDEPTSYLDIKQRLKIAKFIKNIPDDKTAVMVIEHDLIVLDYISDSVYIMYGEEDAYGIVSMVKSTKAGINIFLSGYMKEENIRFRDKAIHFSKQYAKHSEKTEALVSWKNIERKLGKFELKSHEGIIHKREIVGILGENGTGKTTFMKILAKEIKQDKGEIKENISISYKPQYIKYSDEIVKDVLKDAVAKYNTQLIKPLNIKFLLEKKLSELSGGQLQRVAIALCLSKDAGIYLLDEPSAYLDIEQRLVISKIIRDFVSLKEASGVIIEHDLLFLDYLSEKIVVFDGIPSKEGNVHGPFAMEAGMNMFLKKLGITFRRDSESLRPRANKEGSQMDEKQKKEEKYYYV